MFNVESYISRKERRLFIYQRDCTDYTELFLSHAEGAKDAELYSLLLTLALEGSQLHATESAEVTNGKRLTINV